MYQTHPFPPSLQVRVQLFTMFALTQLKVRMRLNQKSLSAFLWWNLKEHFSKNQPRCPNEIKMDYELHSAVSRQRLTRLTMRQAAVPQDVKGQLLI